MPQAVQSGRPPDDSGHALAGPVEEDSVPSESLDEQISEQPNEALVERILLAKAEHNQSALRNQETTDEMRETDRAVQPPIQPVVQESRSRMHLSPEEILELHPIPLAKDILGEDGIIQAKYVSHQLAVRYAVSSLVEMPPPTENQVLPYYPRQRTREEIWESPVRDFLERICSDGRMQWGFPHGHLAIWPTEYPEDLENYLDLRISMKLDGTSFLEALVKWTAETVSRRETGYGIELNVLLPPISEYGKMVYRGVHPSWQEPGEVSLIIEHATAREALCAILAEHPVLEPPLNLPAFEATYHHLLKDDVPHDLLFIRPAIHQLKAELPNISQEEYEKLNAWIHEATLFAGEVSDAN